MKKIINKYIVRFLLSWYNESNREITKVSINEEQRLFRFATPDDVEHLLKVLITAHTIRYFEARSEEERLVIRGATLALLLLKDNHEAAREVEQVFGTNKELQEDKTQAWLQKRKTTQQVKVH